MASQTATKDALTIGRLVGKDDDTITLEIPGTSYKIKLACESSQVTTEIGKLISGTIHAKSLRMHGMAGGGRFIEPVWGQPRIVAGTIRAVDQDAGRVLVNVAVPMWVTCPEGQDFGILEPGSMATFYVESGTSFEPA